MSYFLGLDLSTQSLTLTVLRIEEQTKDHADNSEIVYEHSLLYADDPRLSSYDIDRDSMLIPSDVPGEAMQDPIMFLDALDIAFEILSSQLDCSEVQAISVSAQQHGHVYLNQHARKAFEALKENQEQLISVFDTSSVFAFPYAPIWMMSASKQAADDIRTMLGGSEEAVALSGSDSPARFTGAVMKYIARTYPSVYQETHRVHLLSSFISGVLSANYDTAIDWGNASGMTLMDYKTKTWSETLASAVSEHGDAREVISKLPTLAKATDRTGAIANYFVKKYGFSEHCMVCVGSGDNPQSKVPIRGDLLSLGTSFVIMADSLSYQKYLKGTNAMYDGKNEPFVFGCRTNGALLWDRVRDSLQMDFEQSDNCLRTHSIGVSSMMWQIFDESFPLSKKFEKTNETETEKDYAGIVDSTLALVHHYSKDMMNAQSENVLYVTGGPSNSKEITKRISAFWARPVVKIRSAGASFGAAISAYLGYQHCKHGDLHRNSEYLFGTLIPRLIESEDSCMADNKSIEEAKSYELHIVEQFSKIV